MTMATWSPDSRNAVGRMTVLDKSEGWALLLLLTNQYFCLTLEKPECVSKGRIFKEFAIYMQLGTCGLCSIIIVLMRL